MNKQMYRSGRYGFTIVELLIVIVVVSILASITVVAFNGISQRAHNSAITTHVKQWESILESYIVLNGKPPLANWRCLGDEKTLPAENGYAENFCFKPTNINAGNGSGTTAPADPVLMQTIKDGAGIPSFPGLRFPESPGFMSNSDEGNKVRTFRGVFYDGSSNVFADNPATIGYYATGQTCPIGDRINFWESTPGVVGCAVRLSVNEHGQARGQCNIASSSGYYNSYHTLRSEGSSTVYCYQGNMYTF